MTEWLPHVNATLNATATVLLLWGYWLIRRRQEVAHRRVMVSSFLVSTAFLVCYLAYHWQVGHKRFPTYPHWGVQWLYKGVLLSHILLAVLVPFLAITTIVLGYRDRRVSHRRIARWTFPIWLYVSVTGVFVYLMMYWLFPPRPPATADHAPPARWEIPGIVHARS